MQSANANLTLDATGANEDRAPYQFYERMTLQRLLSPVSEEEFRAHYWEKKPLIVHRGCPDYYGDLFTLQDFDGSLRGGSNYVKSAEVSKKTAKHQGTGPAALERVLTDMRDGHTLILDAVQEYNSKLGRFCRMLGQETVSRHQANVYLTPPNGQGFSPHWDNHDVLVLQVAGSKHWKVEKDRRTLPAKDATIEEQGRVFCGDVQTFTLKQGDLVYIPRGFVHAAECGSEYSMHITVGEYPNTWDDLLVAVMKAAILRDDGLRLSLPFGYIKGDGTGIIKRITEVLRKTADPAFLTQVLDQFRDEIVQKVPLDISGAITSSYQSKSLTLDDKVQARTGLIYTMRPHEEAVTLKVGTRAITFPDFFGEALTFALETHAFAVRDLPGDLGDEEKVAFIERLIQEALVVRT